MGKNFGPAGEERRRLRDNMTSRAIGGAYQMGQMYDGKRSLRMTALVVAAVVATFVGIIVFG